MPGRAPTQFRFQNSTWVLRSFFCKQERNAATAPSPSDLPATGMPGRPQPCRLAPSGAGRLVDITRHDDYCSWVPSPPESFTMHAEAATVLPLAEWASRFRSCQHEQKESALACARQMLWPFARGSCTAGTPGIWKSRQSNQMEATCRKAPCRSSLSSVLALRLKPCCHSQHAPSDSFPARVRREGDRI